MVKVRYYEDYISGVEYFEDPMAIELKKFASFLGVPLGFIGVL